MSGASYRLVPREGGRRLRKVLGMSAPTMHLGCIEYGGEARAHPHHMLILAHEQKGRVIAVRRLYSR